jgi:hypothetical protein
MVHSSPASCVRELDGECNGGMDARGAGTQGGGVQLEMSALPATLGEVRLGSWPSTSQPAATTAKQGWTFVVDDLNSAPERLALPPISTWLAPPISLAAVGPADFELA